MEPIVSPCVERRRTPRHVNSEEHGVVCVRIRPGHDASLLDISASGASIETAYRLLPGAAVDLQLETHDGRDCARGRVVRCAVVGVYATRISYRAAVCFEGCVILLQRTLGEYVLPVGRG